MTHDIIDFSFSIPDNTFILTPRGQKEIQALKNGYPVKSYNPLSRRLNKGVVRSGGIKDHPDPIKYPPKLIRLEIEGLSVPFREIPKQKTQAKARPTWKSIQLLRQTFGQTKSKAKSKLKNFVQKSGKFLVSTSNWLHGEDRIKELAKKSRKFLEDAHKAVKNFNTLKKPTLRGMAQKGKEKLVKFAKKIKGFLGQLAADFAVNIILQPLSDGLAWMQDIKTLSTKDKAKRLKNWVVSGKNAFLGKEKNIVEKKKDGKGNQYPVYFNSEMAVWTKTEGEQPKWRFLDDLLVKDLKKTNIKIFVVSGKRAVWKNLTNIRAAEKTEIDPKIPVHSLGLADPKGGVSVFVANNVIVGNYNYNPNSRLPGSNFYLPGFWRSRVGRTAKQGLTIGASSVAIFALRELSTSPASVLVQAGITATQADLVCLVAGGIAGGCFNALRKSMEIRNDGHYVSSSVKDVGKAFLRGVIPGIMGGFLGVCAGDAWGSAYQFPEVTTAATDVLKNSATVASASIMTFCGLPKEKLTEIKAAATRPLQKIRQVFACEKT